MIYYSSFKITKNQLQEKIIPFQFLWLLHREIKNFYNIFLLKSVNPIYLKVNVNEWKISVHRSVVQAIRIHR